MVSKGLRRAVHRPLLDAIPGVVGVLHHVSMRGRGCPPEGRVDSGQVAELVVGGNRRGGVRLGAEIRRCSRRLRLTRRSPICDAERDDRIGTSGSPPMGSSLTSGDPPSRTESLNDSGSGASQVTRSAWAPIGRVYLIVGAWLWGSSTSSLMRNPAPSRHSRDAQSEARRRIRDSVRKID